MKFTEGYWLRSERANGLFAAEGYAVEKIPGGMRILAPIKKIESPWGYSEYAYHYHSVCCGGQEKYLCESVAL